jgi:hypothetical protein
MTVHIASQVTLAMVRPPNSPETNKVLMSHLSWNYKNDNDSFNTDKDVRLHEIIQEQKVLGWI